MPVDKFAKKNSFLMPKMKKIVAAAAAALLT
jgi:hypothetical protein